MKRTLLGVSMFLCAAAFAACGEETLPGVKETVAVTGVTLDKTTVELTVGETESLTETVLPTNATNKNVMWNSSDASVATVVNGFIKAMAEGTTTITATTEDGTHTAECAVTVIPGPDIYVVGSSGRDLDSGEFYYKATLWKNGVAQILPSDRNIVEANSVYVSGDDVYVAGFDQGQAVLWKNGIRQALCDESSVANSVYVSGDDVYVAGVNNRSFNAVLWVNGVAQILSEDPSYASSVYVSGGDVYVTGYDWPSTSRSRIATIWKNGVAKYLGKDAKCYDSSAQSVYVSGSDVYAVGVAASDNPRFYGVALWENDYTYLLDGMIPERYPNSIYVSGSDVYIAGRNEYPVNNNEYWVSKAVLWKNGVVMDLTDKPSRTSDVYVSGEDVYVAGSMANDIDSPSYGVIWKNDAIYMRLEPDATYDWCVVNGFFVKPYVKEE